jgi:hypothetical protein
MALPQPITIQFTPNLFHPFPHGLRSFTQASGRSPITNFLPQAICVTSIEFDGAIVSFSFIVAAIALVPEYNRIQNKNGRKVSYIAETV